MEEALRKAMEAQHVSVDAVIEHMPVSTSEEQVAALGAVDGVVVKNLFFKDKKKSLFLVVIPHTEMLDTKALAKLIGAKGGMRMPSDDGKLLQETLGVSPGGVTPLAVINDTKNTVKVVLSSTIEQREYVYVHPFNNATTLRMSVSALKTVLEQSGNLFEVLDLSSALRDGTEAPAAAKPVSKAKKAPAEKVEKKMEKTREDLLGIEASKTDDFSKWYLQVVLRSEMVDYYDVSGCYILRPWSYIVWEQIQKHFDANIKKTGVRNSYFPLFVSEASLAREANHIEGFAPEVAWVTKAGSSDLDRPIAIRPTSETIMYTSFSKWISSHRDLPMRLNQWSNVVRWEFKNPTPFIRSREFLWQEGHSAFATQQEAHDEVYEILDLYADVYENLLAVPVTKGVKSEKEKFAGADFTTTVEVFVPAAGRGVQAATSHFLGQNFASMFDISFEDKQGKKQMVWQNSWGLSTRSIGVMVMVHGDDKGLVLPPKVAPIQVVFVPIYYKKDTQEAIDAKIEELSTLLEQHGIRSHADLRSVHNPGFKYNHWEVRGVPLRIEVGPRDLKQQQTVMVARDTGAKTTVQWSGFADAIQTELTVMQQRLYDAAAARAEPLVFPATNWTDFMAAINKGGRALVPWCNTMACEEQVKTRSGDESQVTDSGLSGSAKSLCIPKSQPALAAGTPCFACPSAATCHVFFGRSY